MSSCGFLFFTALFSTVFAHFFAFFLYTILTHHTHTQQSTCYTNIADLYPHTHLWLLLVLHDATQTKFNKLIAIIFELVYS